MRGGPGIPILLALVLGGCAVGIPGLGSPEPGPSRDDLRFVSAADALERGDFRRAARGLRDLAERCEAGDLGRTAVLLLASAELDVRNPWGSPDEAVRLTTAYQRLPDAPPGELALARTLYLLALDRGGTPPGGSPETGDLAPRDEVEPHTLGSGTGESGSDAVLPDSAGADRVEHGPEATLPDSTDMTRTEPAPTAAVDEEPLALPRRYGSCGSGGVVERLRPLPAHPDVPSAVRRAQLHDSLALARDSAAVLGSELEAQRRRIRELEAEIERIRTLLKGGGGGVRDLRP